MTQRLFFILRFSVPPWFTCPAAAPPRRQDSHDNLSVFLCVSVSLWFIILDYPSATSSSIMTAKPSMAPMVEISVLCSRCASGISSSTTT